MLDGFEEDTQMIGKTLKSTWAWIGVITLVCGIGLGFLIWGLIPQTITRMPLPEKSIHAQVDDLDALVLPAQTDELQRVKKMPINSVYIPRLDKTVLVQPQNGFEPSEYDNFQTMIIPHDVTKASWFSDGGTLWGGNEGTTLVAAHIGYVDYSAFYGIHNMQAGDIVWSKDNDGHAQAWAVKDVYAKDHTHFPQEFFRKTGQRQLVLTTCGGRLNSQGYYAQNIFVVTAPIHRAGESVGAAPIAVINN